MLKQLPLHKSKYDIDFSINLKNVYPYHAAEWRIVKNFEAT